MVDTDFVEVETGADQFCMCGLLGNSGSEVHANFRNSVNDGLLDQGLAVTEKPCGHLANEIGVPEDVRKTLNKHNIAIRVSIFVNDFVIHPLLHT